MKINILGSLLHWNRNNSDEQKQVERKTLTDKYNHMYHMVNEAKIAILLLDNKAKILEVNKEFAERFKSTHDDMIGKNVFSFFPEYIIPGREDMFRKVLESKNPYSGVDERKGQWNHMYFFPVKNKKGEVEKIAVYAIDITKQKDAEMKAAKVEADLRKANEAKDNFFSILAHDLINPIGTILKLADYVNLLPDDEYIKSRDSIQVIYDTLLRTKNLLDNLLNWSLSQRGRISLNLEYNNVSQLIKKCLDEIRIMADRKQIVLESDITGGIFHVLDKEMIKTVIRNLLTNAIKFTNRNGKIIIQAVKEKNTIRISVIDNGVGVYKNDLEKLTRIDADFSTHGTDNEMGTGMGLALCQEFLQKHNSALEIYSKPGRGSIFSFVLGAPVKNLYNI